MTDRWRVGSGCEENERMIFRNNLCVGMVSFSDLAKEIVAVLNGAAPNDREWIAQALTHEANRIFNHQQPDYPSNVLDVVAANIRAGKSENLTELPDWWPKTK
jgi:hypothetical protein